MNKYTLLVIIAFISINLNGQNNLKLDHNELKTWYLFDLTNDSIVGISAQKAFTFLNNKKSSEVIIGVIDSGMDIQHEVLKDNIWLNKDEIANNKIDDDANGFIDDVNGWNFVGDLTFQNYEYERIIMNPDLADNKKILNKAKKLYKTSFKEAIKDIKSTKISLDRLEKSHETFTKYFNKSDYTFKEILEIKTLEPDLTHEILEVQNYIASINRISEISPIYNPIDLNTKNIIVNRISALKKRYQTERIQTSGNTVKNDYRATLGDDLTNIDDTGYGNNNVSVNIENEEHSTHVAGIIRLIRNNDKKVDSTNNTLIMPIRILGSGDEHDKDVALSIRYAVDNGAKIINASLRKEFSPNKAMVYESIKYAAEHDVLIIIAAGNESLNLDLNFRYPNDSKDLTTEFTNNVIVVGASNPYYGKNLACDFSNYGKFNVDIFAPGYSIFSTTPNNSYNFKEGTSMAAPVVASIAGLIRSYYPQLSANQVKEIILNSGTKINFKVNTPGSLNKKVAFSELCSSNSIVNAYNAIIMADKLSNEQ